MKYCSPESVLGGFALLEPLCQYWNVFVTYSRCRSRRSLSDDARSMCTLVLLSSYASHIRITRVVSETLTPARLKAKKPHAWKTSAGEPGARAQYLISGYLGCKIQETPDRRVGAREVYVTQDAQNRLVASITSRRVPDLFTDDYRPWGGWTSPL